MIPTNVTYKFFFEEFKQNPDLDYTMVDIAQRIPNMDPCFYKLIEYADAGKELELYPFVEKYVVWFQNGRRAPRKWNTILELNQSILLNILGLDHSQMRNTPRDYMFDVLKTYAAEGLTNKEYPEDFLSHYQVTTNVTTAMVPAKSIVRLVRSRYDRNCAVYIDQFNDAWDAYECAKEKYDNILSAMNPVARMVFNHEAKLSGRAGSQQSKHTSKQLAKVREFCERLESTIDDRTNTIIDLVAIVDTNARAIAELKTEIAAIKQENVELRKRVGINYDYDEMRSSKLTLHRELRVVHKSFSKLVAIRFIPVATVMWT